MAVKVSEKIFNSNLEIKGEPIVDYKSCVTELRKSSFSSISPYTSSVTVPIFCGLMKLFGGFPYFNNAKKN